MAEQNRIIEKKVRSGWPMLITAVLIIIFGLIFPLYRVWGIIVTAVLGVAAFLILRLIFPAKTELIEVQPEYKTGIAELDKALLEADGHLASLRQLNERIPNERITASINRMVDAGDKIVAELARKPEKARGMRRFLTYYLPTAVKLMESYAMQQDLGASGENLNEIKTRIENNSETIARSFETSLDSLYQNEAIDISSDIAVLDAMVNSDKPKS